MNITPIVKTFHNKKGKTIQVLKKEVVIATEKGMQSIAKNVKSIVYDNNLKPITFKEVSWHKGKVIQSDVYQASENGGLILKQGVGKNTKKTLLEHLNFNELSARFLK